MRQGQHKNRSRSRGRRPSNPTGRVYESNGPDVKVRGTAQHVADKYMQLARDAHSSGDRVMAESYYQYAEHYLRLLATTQGYPNQSGPQQQQRRPGGDDGYDDGDDMDGDDEQHNAPSAPAQPPQASHSAPGNGEAEPQPAATAAKAEEDGDGGEQPWGGPEPEFLRRGPANGATRSRRQPRSSRAQGPSAKSTDEAEPSGEDTPEQAN